jgi:hypothetical protein
MSIAEKLLTIAENAPKVYDAGKQDEYSRFWDAFQNKGERTFYWYGFSGYGWTNETIKPKYKVRFSRNANSDANGLFYRCGGNNYDGTPGSCIDFSTIQHMFDFSYLIGSTDMFNSCYMVNINIDISNWTAATRTFAQTYGGYVDNITIKMGDKLTSVTNMFQSCKATNITFTEDSIIACKGLDFSSCPLTHDSLMSIVNALQDKNAIGATGNITFGATNVANLTDAEKAIISQKGWSYT